SSRNTAANNAEIRGYVIETVIERASPRARVLSKNAVSPSQMASTTEADKSTSALADIAITPGSSPRVVTHAKMKAPPRVDRTALRETELNVGDRARTSKPMAAQLSAEPAAHSAPKPASESTNSPLQSRRAARRLGAEPPLGTRLRTARRQGATRPR